MIRTLFWIWYTIGALLLIWFGIPESLRFSSGLFLVFYAAYAMDLLSKGEARPFMSDWSVSKEGFRCNIPIWYAAGLIWLGGMAVEWVGVHTGKLFGEYSYSTVLGPLLSGVPVTLGFAWIAVVCNAALISYDFGLRGLRLRLLRAAQVGCWTVLLDLVLDPVAHARGFWNWEGGGGFYYVPWSNFGGWLIAGAALSLLLPAVPVTRTAARRGTRLYQAVLILFGLISLTEGLPVCAIIAGAGSALAEGSLRYAGGRQVGKL
ncbi:carotenoid biosynthesis protein [Paenibacillus sp. MMS20-IR301]|uniref:carotenoid biosynthesis protein n=1 Tax=Paenibacillus sp. MMS20-IR301 TaxID=2895946 RepID=UPI0028E3757C|nr:carotenoid biosynthesis protein [Paenibacillus sp. MMS20-IR301]WNS42606.1 carotenoid biosynthesis protein [Paenibacillus sp. MMS20-IR301]